MITWAEGILGGAKYERRSTALKACVRTVRSDLMPKTSAITLDANVPSTICALMVLRL